MSSHPDTTELYLELEALEQRIDQIKQQLGLTAEYLPKGISHRKDGRYMARFMHRGKTYTLYGRDPIILKDRLEQLRKIVQSGQSIHTSKLSLDQWYIIWMEQYKLPYVKPTTCHVYDVTYQTHIGPRIGFMELTKITTHQLQQVLNNVSEQVSPRTASGVHVVLGMLFEQAYKNDLLIQNPMKKTTFSFKADMKQAREQRVLTKKEQQIFISFAKQDKYYLAFRLALATGIRSGELRALEWKDIDFDKNVMRIRGTLSYLNGHFYKASPKSISSKRDIPFTDTLKELFHEQRRIQSKYKAAGKNRWQPYEHLEDLVFTTADGKCLSQNVLLDHIHSIEKQILKEYSTWENIHFHTLRHTFATRAIEGGMEPQTLKSILGHSSLSMTMDLYSHVLPDTKASQMQKIEFLF